MDSYFCIVNLPGAPVRDIHVLAATGDAEAVGRLGELAGLWPGFETLELYQGERLVQVTGNPAWGFPHAGLEANAGETRLASAA